MMFYIDFKRVWLRVKTALDLEMRDYCNGKKFFGWGFSI